MVVGVNEQGRKLFLAIEDGVRESKQSWREVLLGRKERGLAGVSEILCVRRSEACPRRRASLATNDRRGGQVGAAYYAAAFVKRSA